MIKKIEKVMLGVIAVLTLIATVYCKKLGVDFPTDPNGWSLNGQKNPYYCAMVEMFDH